MTLSAAELLARDKRREQLEAEPKPSPKCEHTNVVARSDVKWCTRCGALALLQDGEVIRWHEPTG